MDKYKMLTGYQYDFVKNVDANLASRMFRFDLLTQAVLSPPPTYLAQIYGLVDSRVTAAMSCCDALAATTLGWGEAARLFIIVRHINAITLRGWTCELNINGGILSIGQTNCQVIISHQEFLQLIAHNLDPSVRYDPFGWQEAYAWTTSALVEMKQMLEIMDRGTLLDTQAEMLAWRDTLACLVRADPLSMGMGEIALITNPTTRKLLIESSLGELWGAWMNFLIDILSV
jgi:hypothetical protein